MRAAISGSVAVLPKRRSNMARWVLGLGPEVPVWSHTVRDGPAPARATNVAKVAWGERYGRNSAFDGANRRLMLPRANLLPQNVLRVAITLPGRNFCHETCRMGRMT